MRGIALRFWLLVSSLLTALIIAGGGIESWLTYRDSVAAAQRVQSSEARAAAVRISEYLKTVESQLREVATLPWTSGELTVQDRVEEFHRLMKLVPAISEIKSLDGEDSELLFVSRTDMDRTRSGAHSTGAQAPKRSQATGITYGPVYFREGTRPYTSIVIPEGQAADSGTTVAELDLTFVTDVVRGITIGTTGKAYVVDGDNRLVAHPDLSLVLRNTVLADEEHLGLAREVSGIQAGDSLPARWAQSPEGGRVLVSAVHVAPQNWVVFAEEPAEEALQPVLTILYRTLVLLALGLLVAAAASLVLARRLTKPILDVQRGAVKIGAGDLNARISVNTHDEIESLANEFNRMASQLQESYTGLEAKIQERTRELTEAGQKVEQQAADLAKLNSVLTERVAELAQRRDEADRANAAKTRFLAAASHDLRQPMHTISLLTAILRDRLTQRDLQDLMGKVQLSVEAMEKLFESLLDISTLDAGAVRPNIVNFDIGSLLQLIERTYAPQAAQKHIQLTVVMSHAFVRSDPNLLERILGNLVSNAIRYTDTGRIVVGCRRRGGNLCILVIDTGIGIETEFHAEIFEEFFQLAPSGRDRSKGLGLGLSIVKRTADLLGHDLTLRSMPTSGSSFGVAVPLVPRPSAGKLGDPTAASSTRKFEGLFILAIDDDQENRLACMALFEQWGCSVIGAASVAEALEQLKKHLRDPDLIVTDYLLGERATGVTAIELIRQHAGEDIPAIIVTGEMAEINVGLATRVMTLRKPVTAENLRLSAEGLIFDASAWAASHGHS